MFHLLFAKILNLESKQKYMISMHMACSTIYVGVQIIEKKSTIQDVFECKMQVLIL